MAHSHESVIQSKVKKYLEEKGGSDIYIFKVPQGQYTSRRGIPDLVMSIYGMFVAIEVKTDIGSLTPLQELEIKRINRAGALSTVVYGFDTSKLDHIISQCKGIYESRKV